MSRIEHIEQLVTALDETELKAFRDWFAAYDAEAWDRANRDRRPQLVSWQSSRSGRFANTRQAAPRACDPLSSGGLLGQVPAFAGCGAAARGQGFRATQS
jgi:hypothetical protein